MSLKLCNEVRERTSGGNENGMQRVLRKASGIQTRQGIRTPNAQWMLTYRHKRLMNGSTFQG
jgi:hypothetical protein